MINIECNFITTRKKVYMVGLFMTSIREHSVLYTDFEFNIYNVDSSTEFKNVDHFKNFLNQFYNVNFNIILEGDDINYISALTIKSRNDKIKNILK